MQLGRFLRKASGGWCHWCPACGEMHLIPDRWHFDGDIEHPTFQPSVSITGTKKVVDENGKWTGEWVTGPDGAPKPYVCHYILALGIIRYQPDCSHGYAGQNVQLPELPPGFRD